MDTISKTPESFSQILRRKLEVKAEAMVAEHHSVDEDLSPDLWRLLHSDDLLEVARRARGIKSYIGL